MSANQSFQSDRDDLDDLLDAKNFKVSKILQGDELYSQSYEEIDRNKNLIFTNNFRDGTNAAIENIREVLKKVDKYIYNREFEKKITPHCAVNTLILSECFVDLGVSVCDDQGLSASQLEDLEPKKVKIDKWMRAVISVDAPKPHKDLNSNSINRIPQESDKETESQRSHLTRLKKHSISQNKKNDNPTPVNMEPQLDFDEFEERVRTIKQLEFKRKADMEQQEHLAMQEIKRQQLTIKNDVKGFKFTYDFDGKIINTKTIASEKLPPTNYLIQFQLKEDIVKAKEFLPNPLTEDKKNSKAAKEQQQILQQQQQEQEQKRKGSLVKQMDKLKVTSPPFEYDNFTPSHGVKLIYQSRFKEGQRYNPEITDIEQLDMILKSHKESEPLHITKSDYRRLTENGNLNRNPSSISTSIVPPLQAGVANTSRLDSVLLSPRLQEANQPTDLLSSFKKNHELSLDYTKRQERQARSLSSLQKIKISNPKLARDLMQQDTQDREDNENKFPKILERNKSTTQLKASPNDLFNLTLMDDQMWGKGKGGNFIPPDTHLSKPTLNDYKKSLNSLYQLPRERDKLQAMKKVQKQMEEQQLQSKHKSTKSLIISEREATQYQANIRQTFYSSRSGFENKLRNSTLGQL